MMALLHRESKDPPHLDITTGGRVFDRCSVPSTEKPSLGLDTQNDRGSEEALAIDVAVVPWKVM